MTERYISRKKARAMLTDQRFPLWWISCVITAMELIIILWQVFSLYNLQNPVSCFVIGAAIDLLVLSPLKAGRAYCYTKHINGRSDVRAHDLFHFFSYGYPKSVIWRSRLWIVRIFWSVILFLPSAFLLTVSLSAEERLQTTVSVIAFALSLILFIFALIFTEIVLFRYIPVVYCLSELTVREAFKVGKRCSRRFTGQWVLFHLDFAASALSFMAVFPYLFVMPLFHIARAATVQKLFHEKTDEIHAQHLKQPKNHGRIRGEF